MVVILALFANLANGQDQKDLDRIAESQRGASPLVYTTQGNWIRAAMPGNFQHEDETMVRGGLPRFWAKIDAKADITVAFIGGSITQADHSYRMQVSKYLERNSGGARFRWINAGISGTGTDLGACRIQEQVLNFNPDLIFIEFAVNGAYPDGMEGMIRQIRNQTPECDICLIYTLYNGQTSIYQRGEIPENIRELERLAEHYGLPSIHLGMEAAYLEKEGRLIWKGDDEYVPGKILFSKDGIHPTEKGGALYAGAIVRGLKKIREHGTPDSQPPVHREALFSADWENAGMYDPWQIAHFDASWHRIDCSQNESLQKFAAWFGQVVTAGRPGASFRFRFTGDMFGLFDVGGPEMGQLEIEVDGRPVRLKAVSSRGFRYYEASESEGEYTLNRFNRYCNNRYRGQHDIVKLQPGVHDVTIRISDRKADKRALLGPENCGDISQNPAKYDQSVIYLGRLLLRGTPIIE